MPADLQEKFCHIFVWLIHPHSLNQLVFAPARIEISAAGIFRFCNRRHVCGGNRGFHADSLWPDRRRKNAEFLSQYGADSGDCYWSTCSRFNACGEFVVPLSLPIWRADGVGLAAESAEDSARRRCMHRLREVRASLPGESAGGPARAGSKRGMYGVHGMCCGVFVSGRIAVFFAAKTCSDDSGTVARTRGYASGGSRDSGVHFFRDDYLCKSHGPLANELAASALYGPGSSRE